MSEHETQTDALMPTDGDALVPLVDPNRVMSFAVNLRKYIEANRLAVSIPDGNGGTNSFAKVDGWRFAGMNFGLVADVDEPIQIDKGATLHVVKRRKTFSKRNGEKYTKVTTILATTDQKQAEQTIIEGDEYFVKPYYEFKCTAHIKSLATGKVVGHGYAICSNAEAAKVDFDAFAVASMAQTRASGKGFRNLLGYVMNAAGYQPTPAEEMEPTDTPTDEKPTVVSELMTGEQRTEIEQLMQTIGDAEITARINKAIGSFTIDDADSTIKYLKNLALDIEATKGGAS